ncbi:CWC16 protein [Xylariomycetidae sp. FL2044]|nr:CWC16 protein [Xylariomycetidae sp. FL2044]
MQGFNMGRYVPPDLEGTIESGNKLHGKKHAMGASAAQTVRFEMPFAIWCASCPRPTIIGQGVRFNASKARVGSYYSTPVFAFRLRHVACGGAIEIRTDPKNTAYVVVSGAKKRDTGEDKDKDTDPDEEGGQQQQTMKIMTDDEREALRSSAFRRLEKTIEDRERLAGARERIGALEGASRSAWEDPYGRNRALRDAFRVDRRRREQDGRAAEDLRDRMSLGIELLPEREEDARRAKLMMEGFGRPHLPGSTAAEVGEEGFGDGGDGDGGRKALVRPLFDVVASSSGSGPGSGPSSQQKRGEERSKSKSTKPTSSADSNKDHPSSTTNKKNKPKLKSEIKAAQMRESLVSEIMGNTRASQDPFLVVPDRTGGGGGPDKGKKTAAPAPPRILGLKRKRIDGAEEQRPVHTQGDMARDEKSVSQQTAPAAAATTLVEYDSD